MPQLPAWALEGLGASTWHLGVVEGWARHDVEAPWWALGEGTVRPSNRTWHRGGYRRAYRSVIRRGPRQTRFATAGNALLPHSSLCCMPSAFPCSSEDHGLSERAPVCQASDPDCFKFPDGSLQQNGPRRPCVSGVLLVLEGRRAVAQVTRCRAQAPWYDLSYSGISHCHPQRPLHPP